MKFLIVLILAFSSLFSYANNIENNDDAYFQSLKLHIQFLKSLNEELDTVFIKKADYLTDFTGSIDDVFVKMIDDSFIHSSTGNRKKLNLIIINALNFENQKATIYVVDFSVTRKRKHYTMINNGNSKIELTYDCEINKYKYDVTNR